MAEEGKIKKYKKKFNIDAIVNALRAEKRGAGDKRTIENLLGGKIPKVQWKAALKNFKDIYTGYTQTPLATVKGYIEGLTGTRITKQKNKNKKGGTIKTYAKGSKVRKPKY